MSLHDDLLEQAAHLATRDPTRPKQANLRRAISSAYYALFHLLTWEAARLVAQDSRLLSCICRTLGHGEMYEVSKNFASGSLPAAFNPLKPQYSVPLPIRDVAKAFVEMQELRHEADYNLDKGFTRSDAVTAISQVRGAMATWNRERNSDFAKIYVACFLCRKQLDKSR